MTALHVLGTPLLLTDYADLAAHCLAWARGPRCVALDFANTQIVTMGRHEAGFRKRLSAYDAFPPDGMPLVWCLNCAGAQLRDRVYGPTFMRQFLAAAPVDSSHYLIGGSAACGTRLRQTFEKQNPGLRFVGAFHGQCDSHGQLADAQNVIDEINHLSPDFIWVGLGTPKQQAWVERYKPSIRRGVILTVGFAFDVNAGLKPDAPLWMQRCGLTWVYRFCSEPRRLGTRYFKYNALFLFYLLSDGLRGRAWGKVATVPEAIWEQAR